MKKFSWPLAIAVFLVFFGVYSYRLGIEPMFWHDDYEYTYPSFSLAERGNFGSPLLGTALNIQNRTYHFTSYYYAAVHAALIRLFGSGPESIPLANTFHFALLAAAGSFFLFRRRAFLGLLVFLYALASDERMIVAARHGRPEMTAGFGLVMGVVGLWLWYGEGQRRPAVLFGMSTALVAGMLSHTSVLFFAAAVLAAYSIPLARTVRPRDIAAAALPFAAIPVLYGYFILTDSLTNIRLQLGAQQGNVIVGRLLSQVAHGQWSSLLSVTVEFLRLHAGHPGIWLAVVACLAAPAFGRSRLSCGARFFATVYVLFLVVHFLFLKHFVLSYRVIYQATLYMALAFLAEAVFGRLGEVMRKPTWVTVLRVAGIVGLSLMTMGAMSQLRERLDGRHLPYAALQGSLTEALLEAGAEPGDRVFVPTPFAFHLQRRFDVVSYPPNWRYFQGDWTPAFRGGLLEIWGAESVRRVRAQQLCWAMGLAYIQPAWVLSWDLDYSVFRPFRKFFRRFPDLPGMELTEIHTVQLPPPYGGHVRVFRLELSDAIGALDRTPGSAVLPCP